VLLRLHEPICYVDLPPPDSIGEAGDELFWFGKVPTEVLQPEVGAERLPSAAFRIETVWIETQGRRFLRHRERAIRALSLWSSGS
jgi:hypothetical protein